MKLLTAALVVTLAFAASPSVADAQRSRKAGGGKYIDALVKAPKLVTYVEDGAADVSVIGYGEGADMKVRGPLPEVRAIVRLGPQAIPLLIAHLDDNRLTSARFLRREQGGERDVPVPVGHVCLDLLTGIVYAPEVLITPCSDDGLGACVEADYYFRPDAFVQRGGGHFPSPKVRSVKRSWQRAYREGRVRFRYPRHWNRGA